ncbi:MAG: catalase, partial [Hymenobacter sp.]
QYAARLVRQKLDRHGDIDFQQAGDRYRRHTDAERNDLISNLVGALSGATQEIQDKMVEMFTKCDADYGQRVREGLAQAAEASHDMESEFANLGVKSGGAHARAEFA